MNEMMMLMLVLGLVLVLLLMIIYVFAIIFTQSVFDHKQIDSVADEELDYYWGSLNFSMATLFLIQSGFSRF